MRQFKWVLAAIVLLSLQLPARAQTKFDWKFEDTYLEVNHKSHQEITVLNNTKVTDTTIHLVFKVHPLEVTKDAAVLEYTVVACDDVSTPKGGPPEKDIFKGLRDQKFTVTLKPRNQSMEITKYEQILEPIFGNDAKAASPKEKAFFTDIIGYLLRLHVIDAYMPLPEAAVAPGDKWHHTLDMKLQSFAHLTSDREYSLIGKKTIDGKDYNTVGWTSKLVVEPLKDENGVLPFKVKDIKLTDLAQDDGTALWDAATGRPSRVDTLQKTRMEMTMDINGQEIKGGGTTEDTVVFQYSEKNPAEK